MARVVIEHLSKHFQGPRGERICAVKDMNLTVEDKELLVLVGPSGCGKTTTLRLIAGLEQPDNGTISVDGQVVNEVEPRERDVAMVFQHFALYPHMSVYENWAFGLKLRKVPRQERERRISEAADMLDLGGCLERRPMDLSGGQQQRVAVGRAIVRRPRVFLFDEPFSNLDAQMRGQMRAELARLHRRLAATMLYVTHDQEEAMTLGDRIAVMRDGKIQQVGAPPRVYEEPANLFVAGFIGSPPMNLVPGAVVQKGGVLFFEAEAGEEEARPGRFALRLEEGVASRTADCVGRPIVWGVRPQHVGVRRGPEDVTAGRAVRAVVELVEWMGAETRVCLASGGQRLVARVHGTDTIRVGEQVWAVFENGKEYVFDAATEKAVGESAGD